MVTALAALVGGVIVATITRQQQFYRDASALLKVREEVRDAIEILSADVRGMSVPDTVRLAADSAIEFFTAIGTSVVCVTAVNDVGLPPAHTTGNSLSSFLTEPDTGDVALFYTDSAGAGEGWETHRISGFSSRPLAASCPPTSRLSEQYDSDVGAKGFVVTLTTPLRGGVKPGAAVRFLRRARYSLYNASDGGWYLGYRRCDAIGPSACGVVQPVSGPYRAYNPDPLATGLLFEYFDAQGQRLDPTGAALSVARVDVTARSESSRQWKGMQSARRIADSATVSVAIRNGGH